MRCPNVNKGDSTVCRGISYPHQTNSEWSLYRLLCHIFKPCTCNITHFIQCICARGLSLGSGYFVCLMTSLRGLLALGNGSQNEELSCSRVFKGAPSRYMIGNFCHDPPIISIKVDTEDAVQKMICALLAD